MQDVQLYIGHNVGNVPTLNEHDIMEALAALDIEGATFIPARGIWHRVVEETTIVEICAVSPEWVKNLKENIVTKLCDILSQECIMVRVLPSTAEFIG